MPTIFGRLGDDLYDALCEPNSGNRASAPDAWIGQASAVIGTRVREELAAYLAWVMEGRRTEEGWKRDERKRAGSETSGIGGGYNRNTTLYWT